MLKERQAKENLGNVIGMIKVGEKFDDMF